MGVVTMRCPLLALILILISLPLQSCVPLASPVVPFPSVTPRGQWICTEVIDARLTQFPYRAIINTDMASAWVQQQYGAMVTDLQGWFSADGTKYYQYWQIGSRRYDVTGWTDGRESAAARVKLEETGPTLADVQHCLGVPSLYRAYYPLLPDGLWTYIEFWYPKQGIVIEAYITSKVSHITMQQPVKYITYVEPGTSEELISRFTRGIALGTERYAQILGGLKPWPGDISQITIDERG